MKTVKDINLKNKTVLLRADYNVPLDEAGNITDDYRIQGSLPSVKYLLEQNCKVIIISHLGRPDGKAADKYSLMPVANRLSQLLGCPIHFVGNDVAKALATLRPGDVALLENLRFRPEEEANDETFAHNLAHLADVFVQDGFGVVHRAHASTDAITKFIPSVAGLLLEKEVKSLTEAMENPKRPLVAIMGGAKVSDKIELIERFIDKADQIIVGGAIANTFLAGERFSYNLGKSLYEKDASGQLAQIWRQIDDKFGLKGGKKPTKEQAEKIKKFLLLPIHDVAVSGAVDEKQKRREVDLGDIKQGDIILDFGTKSTQEAIKIVKRAKTVIWNGPLGMTELPAFAKASKELAQAIIESGAQSIVGGGDTAGFIEKEGLVDKFTHVSTGGGAALDLMAGKKLPGIEALKRQPVPH